MKKLLLIALISLSIIANAQVKIGSNATILATNSNFQVEGTTTTDQLVVLKNGNVGIGTTAPAARLSVAETNTTALQSTLVLSSNPFAGGTLGFSALNPDMAKYSSGIQFKGWNGLNEGGIFRQTGSASKSHLWFTVNNTNDPVMTLTEKLNVGIGTTTPDASAVLDQSSTSKGTLIPRMTTAQRDAIILPAKGLQIYNTSTDRLQLNVGTGPAPIWNQLDVVVSGDQVGAIKSDVGQGFTLTMDNLIYSISNGLNGVPQVKTVSGTKSLIISEFQYWDTNLREWVIANPKTVSTTNIPLESGLNGNLGMSTTEINSFYVINSTDNTIHKVECFLYGATPTAVVIVSKLR